MLERDGPAAIVGRDNAVENGDPRALAQQTRGCRDAALMPVMRPAPTSEGACNPRAAPCRFSLVAATPGANEFFQRLASADASIA